MVKRADQPDPHATQADEAEDLVELVLADHAARAHAQRPPPVRIEGVVIGHLDAISADGRPIVGFDEWTGSVAARATVPVAAADIGRSCALLFEGGDPSRPILMGWMYEQAVESPAHESSAPAEPTEGRPKEAVVEQNGDRVVFEADKEIVLRCGKASITLTRAGKILIRGAYLLARSSGVNRIQGGSVQIN